MAAQRALTDPIEYLEFEERSPTKHEYVQGVFYAMAGASINHGRITRNLSGELLSALRGRECENFDADVKVWIEEAYAYYYPDASVASPPNIIDAQAGVIDNPTVLFEVSSPSTERTDRVLKFNHYRLIPSLREYIMIASERVEVQQFTLEDGEWYVRTFCSLDDKIDLASIDVRLSLVDLYRHVGF